VCTCRTIGNICIQGGKQGGKRANEYAGKLTDTQPYNKANVSCQLQVAGKHRCSSYRNFDEDYMRMLEHVSPYQITALNQ